MHLVLAGAGQAHLEVLRRFGRRRPEGMSALTLIAPEPFALQTAAMPAVLAGLLPPEAARIPLAPLLEAAGARWLRDRVTGLEADARQLRRGDGSLLAYDLLSLNLGARPLAPPSGTLPARPWSGLLAAVEAAWPRPGRIAVIGGGLAGVELALALAQRTGQSQPGRVLLVEAAPRLLPALPIRFAERLRRALEAAGVTLHLGLQVLALRPDGVLDCDRGDGRPQPLPEIALGIACTGAGPPVPLAGSGLACDADGFPLVDARLRSPSHGTLFAVGQGASAQGMRHGLPGQGFWTGPGARQAGAALARNLRQALRGDPPRAWTPPRRRGPILLASGRCRAIGLWHGWSFEGRWAWAWKRRREDGILRRYAPAATPPQRPALPE